MQNTKLVWKIGGEAGQGIAASGLIFSRTCARAGYYIFDYGEYPSLIRGGHNTYQVRVAAEEIHSMTKTVHILVALNKETVDLHKNELAENAALIYDSDTVKVTPDEFKKTTFLCPVPLGKLTKDAGGSDLMRNSVAIGATLAIIDLDFATLEKVLRDIFADKGEEVINLNINVAKAGFDFGKTNFPPDFPFKLLKANPTNNLVIAGNESIVLGAIQSGCKFYSGYPMTPSSTILQYMAQVGPKYNVVVKHAEDEISVINMAIGASVAGVRSMCATSGGGFSLMVEGYGLAGITETPLVVVDAQRPGPATGMPTWTGQGDLQFVLNAAQDEWARIVIAPGDTDDCFYLTAEAFNLAEKYQTTVMILTDKFLGESHKSTKKFDTSKVKIERGKILSVDDLSKIEKYNRYQLTEDGISTRSIPGQKGGVFLANSYEHDEYGFATENSNMRTQQMDKRMKKLEIAAKDIPQPAIIGQEKAQVTIIGWGSTKGPIIDAIKILENDGILVNFLQIKYLNPFPTASVIKIMDAAKTTMVIENNSTSQLGRLISEQTGKFPEFTLLKYDGRPFFPEEIVAKVKEVTDNV